MSDLADEQQDAVIQSITQQTAERKDVAPDDLPPLFQAIDPTIFNYLPEPSTLTFEYCGYTVAVDGDGTVAVQERMDGNLCPEA